MEVRLVGIADVQVGREAGHGQPVLDERQGDLDELLGDPGGMCPRRHVRRVEVDVVADVGALADRPQQRAVDEEGVVAVLGSQDLVGPLVEPDDAALPLDVVLLAGLQPALLGEDVSVAHLAPQLPQRLPALAVRQQEGAVPRDRQPGVVDADRHPGGGVAELPHVVEAEPEPADLLAGVALLLTGAGQVLSGARHRSGGGRHAGIGRAGLLRSRVGRGDRQVVEVKGHPGRRAVRRHRHPPLDGVAREQLHHAERAGVRLRLGGVLGPTTGRGPGRPHGAATPPGSAPGAARLPAERSCGPLGSGKGDLRVNSCRRSGWHRNE